MAKNRITELKQKDFSNKTNDLLQNQQREREEVESAHFLEYQEFNNKWDEEMGRTQAQNQEMINVLEEKHIKELEENRQKLESQLPT